MQNFVSFMSQATTSNPLPVTFIAGFKKQALCKKY